MPSGPGRAFGAAEHEDFLLVILQVWLIATNWASTTFCSWLVRFWEKLAEEEFCY